MLKIESKIEGDEKHPSHKTKINLYFNEKAPCIQNECREVEISTQNSFNCWKFLKLAKPQHKDEKSFSVTVTKVEKIRQMAYG